MDSLQLVKMFYLALVSSFIIVQIHCDIETNQSDTWDFISSDFQLGIPNLNKPLTESTKTRIDSTADRRETDYVKKQTDKMDDQFDRWDDLTDSDLIIPDPMAVRSLLKPVDEKAYSVSQSFMEGKPENQQPKTTLVKSVKSKKVDKSLVNQKVITTGKPLLKISSESIATPKANLIKFNQKDGIGLSSKKNSTKKAISVNNKRQLTSKFNNLKHQMNGSIRRTSDGSVGLISIKNRVNKMKRKLTPEAKRRMIIGSPRLLSQESYLSPMAQFSPFTSIGTGSNQLLQAGQISLSPSISYLAPASQVQFSPSVPMAPTNVNAAPLSPSNLIQNQGSFQTNQIVGSTSNSVNLIPVNNIQSVASLASPGVQTIVPTNQGIFTSNFQSSPMQSPLQSTVQSSPMVQIASVNQSPNVQTIPVIQNAIPVSLVPSSVGSAPPLKITKTQQFESHIVNSPVALASPSISSAPYSPSLGSSLRSNFIRTPIALRSQIQRATSYFSPSLPTRSQTVYTQTQLVPTHTTVYTTTQFSPATRTIVYETDHVPIYAQTATDSGISAKTSSKYGSSIASLAKYGTSFY